MPYFWNIPDYIILSREPDCIDNIRISRKYFLVPQSKEIRNYFIALKFIGCLNETEKNQELKCLFFTVH
jgi:hypothetical protein